MKKSENVDKTTENRNFMSKNNYRSVTKVKKKGRKIPKCVRYEEFFKLIRKIPKKDNTSRIAFLLSYGAGMRLSEVLRCSPEHFKPNSIFIPESKYGVERIVPIPKGWKQGFTDKLPLFQESHAKFQSKARILQRKFTKFKKKAGLPDYYTFHSLRHGFATRCIEQGMPPNQVQVLLGHSNLATTSVYTKANPKDALNKFEEVF